MIEQMSKKLALQIKSMRTGKNGYKMHSLRALAEKIHAEYDGDWQPPDNQLAGSELALEAAMALGEMKDGNRPDWA
jgi:hypothetical protein